MLVIPTCPQCGGWIFITDELRQNEGVCRACCESNQRELDEHNYRHDEWEKKSPKEREDAIKIAAY